MDLFVVPISSVLPNTDLPLRKWREAALNVPSGVKAQLATVEQRLVLKIVGQLTTDDAKTLNHRLKDWMQL